MKLIIIMWWVIIFLQTLMLWIAGYILIEKQIEIQSSIYEIEKSLQDWEIIPN